MNDWDPFVNCNSSESMSPQCSHRLKTDISTLLREPLHGILIEADESNFLRLHVLITGPDDTPYEKGFFYFVVGFPTNYPFASPKLRLMTTGGGKIRFNPNLYSSGKVCLSILGTYPGPKWTAALGIKSVLLSVQALLNSNPHTNEPGFERERKPGDFEKYNLMITHHTLRVAVLGMANAPPSGMPENFSKYIHKEFIANFPFYENLVVKNITLSGQHIVDPLYRSRSEGLFEFVKILDSLESTKAKLEEKKPDEAEK